MLAMQRAHTVETPVLHYEHGARWWLLQTEPGATGPDGPQTRPADDSKETSGHRMFEWGLFGWFALLSWAGVVLIVIAMMMGNGS